MQLTIWTFIGGAVMASGAAVLILAYQTTKSIVLFVRDRASDGKDFSLHNINYVSFDKVLQRYRELGGDERKLRNMRIAQVCGILMIVGGFFIVVPPGSVPR